MKRPVKYSVGIAYVVAYRNGKTVKQIAKFFKKSLRAVTASLKHHGIGIASKESRDRIKAMRAEIVRLKQLVKEEAK